MSPESGQTSFHPNSLDATLARILANQDEANRKADAILTQVVKTNGRVTNLETWREVITGKMAIISAGVACAVSFSIWAIDLLSK
jgi:hypothetical protein